MKNKRYSDAQIMGILKLAESGVPVADLCREHGMSNASFYKWREEFGRITVGRDVERVIAIGSSLVFAGSDDLDPVLAHQPPNPAVSNVQPQFLQFLGHPGPPVTLQAKAVLFSDMGQKHHVFSLTLVIARTFQARKPRDVTCMTRHRLSTGQTSF